MKNKEQILKMLREQLDAEKIKENQDKTNRVTPMSNLEQFFPGEPYVILNTIPIADGFSTTNIAKIGDDRGYKYCASVYVYPLGFTTYPYLRIHAQIIGETSVCELYDYYGNFVQEVDFSFGFADIAFSAKGASFILYPIDDCEGFIEFFPSDILIVDLPSRVAHIEVTKFPDKMFYKTGEYFDPKGMAVTAYYDNGSSETITDYTYSPSGELTLNDTAIIISYLGKTTTLPIFVLGEININETDKRYLYFKDRQFIDASAGENLCRIDARSGILHFSRNLLSFGGKKLPLNLSLVYDFQHCNENSIYGRETGFPNGFRTNYHQTCVPKDGKYYYTDGGAYLHVFEKALNTNIIYVDRQGTGLLLENEGSYIKIYDEYGNYSLFDGYGRLYQIHQKFTSSSSADLIIKYDGNTEKITSIVDGMGRITNFNYSASAVTISVNSINKLAINITSNVLSSIVRYSDRTETDNYNFKETAKSVITAANGEELTLYYSGDAVSEYHSNTQDKTYYLNYERENNKTAVTDNKGVEQVLKFNSEGALKETYQTQRENGTEESVDFYYVDKEACATFSSALATEPLIKFYYYDTSEYIKLLAGKSESSNKEFLSRVPDTKFSVFSVKMEATDNTRNKSGKITAELIAGDNTILCSLQFNPSIEGLQIAAKPFTANADKLVRVKLKVDCDYGEFKFTDSVILPMLGSVEKLCSNINIDEGGFSYLHNDYDNNYRVFFLNGGTGVQIDGKDYNEFKLYTDDYLANVRNVHKNVINGGFIFWYNDKRGCYVGAKSATVTYGYGKSITFGTSGITSVINGDKIGVKLYSLSSGPNGISTLNSLNYDSKSFPNGYDDYYLQVNTIITDGEHYTENSSYYDENLNLCIEQQRENPNTITQQTTYTLDSSGNVTAVKTTAGNDNILSEYAYDSKGYQIAATSYIGSLKSQSKSSYDLFGNILSYTEPNSFLTNYEYDIFGDRLVHLNAKIGANEISNNIDYESARVSQMSANADKKPNYSFNYYTNGGNLKSVDINGKEYLNIEYQYTNIKDTVIIKDTVTKNYANGFQEKNVYDKYGRLIQKNSAYLYMTTYYDYRNSEGAAGKLWRIVDADVQEDIYFDYNAYNQLTSIQYYAGLNGQETIRCDINYDEDKNHLLPVGETYFYQKEKFESISYEYREDLNYYSDVKKAKCNCNGVSLNVQKEWDALNRVTYITTQSETTNNGMQYDIKYLARTVNGTGTTNFISDWTYYQNINNSLSGFRRDTFDYDINGNITKYTIYEGVNKYEIEYVYDSANRLIRENDQKYGKTYVYAYDSNGNIIAKQGYPYTTGNLSTPTQNYFYDNDRLIKCQGLEFAYDACGNPTTYKGENMTWERGRLLKTYRGCEFYYDAAGERRIKYVGNIRTNYYTINGKLLREESPSKSIIYLHGASEIIGCIINGTHYYYVKNLFGDVVQIRRTSDNAVVAKYYYDAWGECAVENYTSDYVGNINPIRYRSYYWDDDVKFYYLHTRWYDPNIGRFLNLDQIEYLDPEIVNGLNLYAYCLNNPVMGVDPYGTWFTLLTTVVGAFVGAVLGIVDYALNFDGEFNSYEFFKKMGAGAAAGATAGLILGITKGAGITAASYVSAAVYSATSEIVDYATGVKELTMENVGSSILTVIGDTAVNGSLNYLANSVGAKIFPTNSGWFRPEHFASYFTKTFGQRMMLQTITAGYVSGISNIIWRYIKDLG